MLETCFAAGLSLTISLESETLITYIRTDRLNVEGVDSGHLNKQDIIKDGHTNRNTALYCKVD